MKICMLSKTPLVGAPNRMAAALNLIPNLKVDLFTFSDYPNHLKGLFEIGVKVDNFDHIDVSNYDLVWVHNSIPDKLWAEFESRFKNVLKVLQFHSGTHEGPLNYQDFDSYPYSIFDRHLVVAQAWARLYPEALMVPNIVPLHQPEQCLDSKSIKIIYTPSHGGGGRFGFKDSARTTEILKFFRDDMISIYKKDLELIIPSKPIVQSDLMLLRAHCHISIDECFSGGFHQVSLEAMVTGGVAVSGADIFSLLAYSSSIEADELPPFEIASHTKDLYTRLIDLTLDNEKLYVGMQKSRDYSAKYLDPHRLAEIVYRKLMEFCFGN